MTLWTSIGAPITELAFYFAGAFINIQ